MNTTTKKVPLLLITACIFICLVLLAQSILLHTSKKSFEKEIALLQAENKNHENFLATIENRKARCQKETQSKAGSYGSFQYCVNFLQWIEANPFYESPINTKN